MYACSVKLKVWQLRWAGVTHICDTGVHLCAMKGKQFRWAFVTYILQAQRKWFFFNVYVYHSTLYCGAHIACCNRYLHLAAYLNSTANRLHRNTFQSAFLQGQFDITQHSSRVETWVIRKKGIDLFDIKVELKVRNAFKEESIFAAIWMLTFNPWLF